MSRKLKPLTISGYHLSLDDMEVMSRCQSRGYQLFPIPQDQTARPSYRLAMKKPDGETRTKELDYPATNKGMSLFWNDLIEMYYKVHKHLYPDHALNTRK